jgi:hypothetical protein
MKAQRLKEYGPGEPMAVSIEYCVRNGAIACVGPLTCILSPSGGEGRVRGDGGESLA